MILTGTSLPSAMGISLPCQVAGTWGVLKDAPSPLYPLALLLTLLEASAPSGVMLWGRSRGTGPGAAPAWLASALGCTP